MNSILFALKRSLCRPLFLLLLLVCAAAIGLAGSAARAVTLPSAGVCSLSDGPEAGRITDYLLENGFILFEDPAEMELLVEQGRLDCAALLPADLTERMTDGEMEGCVRWVISSTSFAPSLFRSHLSAALYREYAPFLTAPIFEGTDVPREEVFRSYEQMFEEGYAFSFDVKTTREGEAPADLRARSLTLGAASILLCALVFSSCGELLGPAFRDLLGRLGLRKTLAGLVLPGALVRALCVAAAGCAGVLISGAHDLLFPVIVYVFLLTGLSLGLAALLPGVRQLYVLLSVLILSSLALCPIFTDAALFSPALEAIRLILPTYWLWLIPRSPLLWAVGALFFFLLGLGAPALRYRALGNYRLF